MDGLFSFGKHALWVMVCIALVYRGFDSYDRRIAVVPKNYEVVAGKCVEVLDK